MKKILLALLLLSIGMLLWFNTSTQDENQYTSQLMPTKPSEIKENEFEKVIRVGIFEPLTGAGEEGGKAELEGFLLANELYPQVDGVPIELYIEDIKSDRYATVDALNTLIDRKKVHALLGSWGSSFALAAGPIVNEEGVPTIGASCTNPKITIGNKYYSRVSYVDTFQGTALANFASDELKATTTAIVTETNNDYSVDLGAYFKNAFAELHNYNQSILYEGYYQQGTNDFKTIVSSIKNLDPDIVFIPGNHVDVAHFAIEASNQGLQSKIIATDTVDTSDFLKLAGEKAEGVYFSTFYSTEIIKTQESKVFLDAYRKKYGKDPTSFSALAYDAYLLLYDSLVKCKTTESEALNDAIHNGKGVKGAAGEINMDQNGDTKRPVVIKTVKNNKFVYVTSIEPIK